jgi:hypothetical protein
MACLCVEVVVWLGRGFVRKWWCGGKRGGRGRRDEPRRCMTMKRCHFASLLADFATHTHNQHHTDTHTEASCY